MVIQSGKDGVGEICIGGYSSLLDVFGLDSKRHLGNGAQNMFSFSLDW